MFRVSTISLTALLAATPTFAQTSDDANATKPGDEIIVTASRSGEGIAANRLGSSVSVIDSEALQQRQTRVISDVLRDVPGVAVNRTGAVGGLTQIRVRGAEGNHVLVLIDGIEVADPYYGEYDFGTLIADPAARIEVLRGQQSSLYGSDAIGGVINYITLSGREAPGISARLEGGSFGTISGGARAAGATDTLDYAVSGSYYGTDGYPTARFGTRDVGSESIGATAKVNWAPSENFKLTGVLRYSYTDADTNNSENDPTSPFFGYTVDSPGIHFQNEAFYGLLSAQLSALDGRWINTLSGQFADTTRKGFDADGFDYGDKGRRYKGSFTSSFRFGTEALSHRLTAAVDVEREEFQNTTPGTGSPFDAFRGKRGTDNIGIVGQYELQAGDLSLGASVRRDENNRFDDVTTWRVQGSYLLPTGTRVRGAYGTGVKNPGYYELYGYSDGRYIGNPNLKPEKSEGWEAGLEQSFGANDWATIGATYFDAKLKNEIFTSYPPPNFVATPSNRTTDSKQHGVEAFVSARPIPQIRFDLAYTWLKAEENGVKEVRRPKHIASFNTTISSADQRFAGTLTVRYNGRNTDVVYTDPTYVPVLVSMKEYVLVNLGADYKISDHISVYGRVENLFGEDYEEIFSFATAGRAAYGGVRLRF
jgi:vitamin B12 transporter